MTMPEATRWTRRGFLATAGGAAAAVLAGCSLQNAGSEDPAGSAWGGALEEPPLPMPDLEFTDMYGKPYALRERTKGKLTIFFPGYSHCPDVCPVFLNIISQSLDKLTQADGGDTQVLFATVDPDRDTPEVLKTYLTGIHPNLLGLTAPKAVVNKMNDALYLPPVEYGTPDKNGDYTVSHGSKAYAFTSDGKAHRFYSPDTRQQVWVRDLPRLAKGQYK